MATYHSKEFHLDQLPEVAAELLATAQELDLDLWLLIAPMGAGKTTLAKAVAQQAGSTASTSSPTFGIVNTYDLPKGKAIHHFDLYRTESVEELDQMGFWEYLDSGNTCLIEWPQLVQDQMEKMGYEVFLVRLHVLPGDRRLVVYGTDSLILK